MSTCCSEFYKCSLPSCPDEITLDADLEADTEYHYDFVDGLGNHYKGELTTNGYASAVIDCSELPEGLFIPEQGDFLLSIYDSTGQKVDLTLQAKQYTSVLISFYNYEGEVTEAIIE